jgi:hypothetical protein
MQLSKRRHATTGVTSTSDDRTASTRTAIDPGAVAIAGKLRLFPRHDNESGQP